MSRIINKNKDKDKDKEKRICYYCGNELEEDTNEGYSNYSVIRRCLKEGEERMLLPTISFECGYWHKKCVTRFITVNYDKCKNWEEMINNPMIGIGNVI